jgi:ABC-2 type transport system ATP-binding protein
MIEARRVTYEYPGVRALDDVSFSLPPRSITALVGPNGAGKTTLLRCLAALEEPLAGEIRVDGVDVRRNPRLCHQRIGYLSDFFGLYDELSARRCLLYAAGARGIPPPERAAAAERAAERLGLVEHLEARAGELSRGLRQRLAIAQALLHEPRVLLLDEPAAGLDPDARHSLSLLFRELEARGMTLLVSSHILAELEEYCSHILILRAGRIVEHRALAELAGPRRELRLALAAPAPALLEILRELPGVERPRLEGPLEARFEFDGDAAAQHALLRRLLDAGLAVCALAEEKANLQEVYRARLRAESGGGPA